MRGHPRAPGYVNMNELSVSDAGLFNKENVVSSILDTHGKCS